MESKVWDHLSIPILNHLYKYKSTFQTTVPCLNYLLLFICSGMSFTTGTVYLSPFGPTETGRALILCMFVYKHLEAIQRPSAIRGAAAAATIGAPKRKNRPKEETCHHLAQILCQSLAIMSMCSIINYWREQVAYHSFFIPYAINNMGSIYLLQTCVLWVLIMCFQLHVQLPTTVSMPLQNHIHGGDSRCNGSQRHRGCYNSCWPWWICCLQSFTTKK